MIISRRKIGNKTEEELIVDANSPQEAVEIVKREFLKNNPDIDPDTIRITELEELVEH